MSRFDVVGAPTLTRPTDSAGSHEAIARLEARGRLEAQRQQVLAAVRAYPGSTSKELEVLAGVDRSLLARRLPNLEDRGEIYAIAPSRDEKRPRRIVSQSIVPCRYTETRGIRWYPYFAKPQDVA